MLVGVITICFSLLPYPFGRGLFLYGDPLRVPRDADAAAQERARLELEIRLDTLTDAADRELGLTPEEPPPPHGERS